MWSKEELGYMLNRERKDDKERVEEEADKEEGWGNRMTGVNGMNGWA